MRYALLLLTLFILSKYSTGQTTVPAGNVSGLWTAASSPYQVQGDITVPAGQSLIIEPGTSVEFASSAFLRVNGELTAIGTSSDPIVFTPTVQSQPWDGIKLDQVDPLSDSTILHFCHLDHATNLIWISNFNKVRISNSVIEDGASVNGSGIFMSNSDALIQQNLIRNNVSSSWGGGMYVGGGTPLIEGNTFDNNNAGGSGGGLHLTGNVDNVIRNNTFMNNTAFTGGAINLNNFCDPLIEDNHFENNTSVGANGGAIVGSAADPTLLNNTFLNNSTDQDGGALYFFNFSDLTLSGNYFEGNNSDFGGAIYLRDHSSIASNEDIYYDNNALSGGAIYIWDEVTTQIRKCTFSNNHVTTRGGALFISSAVQQQKIINCLFANNRAWRGGVVSSSGNSSNAEFSNCTMSNNESTNDGGVLVTTSGGSALFTNCVLWGNTSPFNGTILHSESSSFTSALDFVHCNIEGGASGMTFNNQSLGIYTNNIELAPQFITPSGGSGELFDGLNANWSISATSPCFNKGTPDTTGLLLPATDLGGANRVILDTVDIGAYELLLEAEVFSQTNDLNVCDGDSVELSITYGGVPSFTFQWQFNGVNIPGETNDTLSVQGLMANSGDYRCIIANGYGADTSQIITVTYWIPASLPSLGPDFGICAGDTTILHADQGTYNYNWNNGMSTSDSLIVTMAGAYFYSVVDTNACSAQSDTIVVSEYLLPTVNLIGDTLCVGDSLALHAGSGFVSYDWNNGLSANDSIVVSATGNYFVSVTDGNNCVGKDTTHVLFNSLPVVDLGINQEICQGDSIQFTPGIGFVSYDWNNGYASTSSIYANSPGNWFVDVIDSNGCENSDTVLLTLLPTSAGIETVTTCDSFTWIDGNTYTASNNTATHTLTNVVGCDSIITLDLTILNSTTGTDVITACNSYNWIDGNTYISSNNTAQWTLTNAQGCDSIVTLDLTINTATANVSSNDPELIADPGATSYQWLDCLDGYAAISGATSNSFIPTSNGEYAVVIEENGCLDTSTCYVINNVGLSVIESHNWKLYPNPTKGNITLEFHGTQLNAMVEITNPLGQIIIKQEINASEVELKLGEESGIYFVRVTSENREEVLPVVKL